MTFAPARLLELQRYIAAHTTLSPSQIGIVGDTDHANRGVSYHLGKSQLRQDAYSRQTARDKFGLSEAASAMDIGNHRDLRHLSVWLVTQARENAPGTSDLREIIYSPDGQKVLRWDRERGYSSQPRTGEADDTHLWHTHISWYRNTEDLDKVGVFRPYYEPEAPVRSYTITGPSGSIDIIPNPLNKYLLCSDDTLHEYTFTSKDFAIPVSIDPPLGPHGSGYLVGDDLAFIPKANATFHPDESDAQVAAIKEILK